MTATMMTMMNKSMMKTITVRRIEIRLKVVELSDPESELLLDPSLVDPLLLAESVAVSIDPVVLD